MNDYLTAAEVMAHLGIKQQTLYTYVSRQLIRRVTPLTSKRSLYSREDVEKLAARRSRKASSSSMRPDQAESSLTAIGSSLTHIATDGPAYRGRNFRTLVEHPGRIENVAELLWTGVLLDDPLTWDNDDIPSNMEAAIAALQRPAGHVPILRVMATASIILGEPAGKELRSGSTASLARRLVCTYAGCLGMLSAQPRFVRPLPGESVAHIALRALDIEPTAAHLAALNAVLITCADHELSSATYAARVVASAGAGLHACLLASIAAHSGHQLGGSCDRTEDLFLVPPSRRTLDVSLASQVRTGGKLPGFNHPLYPNGDPRASYLLALATQLAGEPAMADIHATVADARDRADQTPALELGLVAMARALDLPRRAASALWALGRSVGWVAHVIEQRLAGQIIRPRARYVRR